MFSLILYYRFEVHYKCTFNENTCNSFFVCVVCILCFICGICGFQVQIRPWNLGDSDFVMDGSQPLDPRKTIFVGGVPRPLRAGTHMA